MAAPTGVKANPKPIHSRFGVNAAREPIAGKTTSRGH